MAGTPDKATPNSGPGEVPALRCPHCGYDLSGRTNPLGRCPECGLGDMTRIQLRPGEMLEVAAADDADLQLVRSRRLRRLQPFLLLRMALFWACIGAVVGFAAPAVSMLVTGRRWVISPPLGALLAGFLAPAAAILASYLRAARRPPSNTVVVRRVPPRG